MMHEAFLIKAITKLYCKLYFNPQILKYLAPKGENERKTTSVVIVGL